MFPLDDRLLAAITVAFMCEVAMLLACSAAAVAPPLVENEAIDSALTVSVPAVRLAVDSDELVIEPLAESVAAEIAAVSVR